MSINKGDPSTAVKDEVFPGWGLPVHYMPEGQEITHSGFYKRDRFKDAIQDWSGGFITLREVAMMRVIGQLMEKPEWERKVFDEAIVEKWKGEALSQYNFSIKMWDYVSTGSAPSEHEDAEHCHLL